MYFILSKCPRFFVEQSRFSPDRHCLAVEWPLFITPVHVEVTVLFQPKVDEHGNKLLHMMESNIYRERGRLIYYLEQGRLRLRDLVLAKPPNMDKT